MPTFLDAVRKSEPPGKTGQAMLATQSGTLMRTIVMLPVTALSLWARSAMLQNPTLSAPAKTQP